MEKRYVLAIDEGTTSERVVLYDILKNEIIDSHSRPIKMYYPKDGYVEQDAKEIYKNVKISLETIIKSHNLQKNEILGIGLTNQRETVVAWDNYGNPLYHAIVWQCRRTANFCDNLPDTDKQIIKNKTGLIMDAYFSASKMRWLIENVNSVKDAKEKGELHLGTIDTYLVYMLSRGKTFVTDTTNASRTMLVNLKDIQNGVYDFDKYLLKYFGINREFLPQIVNSSQYICDICVLNMNLPLLSIIGDQQASLVGQCCFSNGEAKNTYGTGCFFMQNVGLNIDDSMKIKRLLTTVGYSVNGKTHFAIEGSIFHAGSIVSWLESNMRFISSYKDIDKYCEKIKNNGGVYLLPAFTGIGAPYWNGFARAKFTGMTLDTKKEHLVRACMESICYLTRDILNEAKMNGLKIDTIVCDGGVSNNQFVMQFQSDILNKKIYKSYQSESTAIGAIYLALLSGGVVKNMGELRKLNKEPKQYIPKMKKEERERNIAGWEKMLKENL